VLYGAGEHGFDTHSSISVSQLVPVHPGAHVHVYLATRLLQLAPFWQGFDAQLFIFVAQFVPVNPGKQLQE
jgi:hypothetical protein